MSDENKGIIVEMDNCGEKTYFKVDMDHLAFADLVSTRRKPGHGRRGLMATYQEMTALMSAYGKKMSAEEFENTETEPGSGRSTGGKVSGERFSYTIHTLL